MCCTKKLKILHKVVRCHSTDVTQNNFFMREKLGPKIPFLVFQQYLLNESTYKLRFLRMMYQILSAIKWHQSCAESVNQSFNNKKRMYRENTKFPQNHKNLHSGVSNCFCTQETGFFYLPNLSYFSFNKAISGKIENKRGFLFIEIELHPFPARKMELPQLTCPASENKVSKQIRQDHSVYLRRQRLTSYQQARKA